MKLEIKFTRKNNRVIIDQPDGSKLRMGEDQFALWSNMITRNNDRVLVEIKTKTVKKSPKKKPYKMSKKEKMEAEIHAEIFGEVNCYYS
tara:strand:+ start:1737 stop:2003 length:267 start_codon:yes stop_codon:yes gene_type:complete